MYMLTDTSMKKICSMDSYMFTRLKQFTNNQNNNIVASDL